jgi:hypothetical protein
MNTIEITHVRYQDAYYRLYRKFRKYMNTNRARDLAVDITHQLRQTVMAASKSAYSPYGGRIYSPCGGYTNVRMLIGDKYYYGKSHCSLEDNYDKRIGIVLALVDMIVSNLDLDKDAWYDTIVNNLGTSYVEDAMGVIIARNRKADAEMENNG